MRVIRHPEVPQELEAAALWYEERQSGLGEYFLAEYQLLKLGLKLCKEENLILDPQNA